MMAKMFAIPVGMRMRVTTSFSAANENAVQVFDQANGELVYGNNNYRPSAKPYWDSGVNDTGAPRLIVVKGIHKNTPPNGNEPWHDSLERVLYTSAAHNTTIVGYEDATDMDFNDAEAVVQLFHS